jgi:hypothetical protein
MYKNHKHYEWGVVGIGKADPYAKLPSQKLLTRLAVLGVEEVKRRQDDGIRKKKLNRAKCLRIKREKSRKRAEEGREKKRQRNEEKGWKADSPIRLSKLT